MSGCLVHESGRAFGCASCDAIATRATEPGWRNFAWLRTRIIALEAEVAALRGLRCTGGSGCPAHLILNTEDNAKGCEHGTLVGYCNRCQRVIKVGDTHEPKSTPKGSAAADKEKST